MKKFLMIFLLTIGFSLNTYADDITWFQATQYSSAKCSNGQWTWSNWYDCSVRIKFVITNKTAKMVMYGSTTRTYKLNPFTICYYTDPNGASAFSVCAKNPKGQDCVIKFHPSPTNQIYVCYKYKSYVYSVYKQ